MAAELEHLIAHYRRHGLAQAAEHLAIAKMGLEACGVIPPRLGNTDQTLDEPPSASIEFNEYGYAIAPGPWVLWHQALPLDVLGLWRQTRNALVRSGFVTVALVQAAADEGLLRKVGHIGKKRASEITAKLQETRLPGVERRRRRPDLLDGTDEAQIDANLPDEPELDS